MTLARQWILLGSMFGFFGVLLGAFGAHALKNSLSERSAAVYQTAVQYQMIHALALVALGVWGTQTSTLNTAAAGYSFTLGILLFSGSLFALALTDLRPLGMITPVGGLAFLVGWFNLSLLAWKVQS